MSESGRDEIYARRGTRIIGLPVQFVIVAVVSLALTIYLAGWAASANIEARDIQLASVYGGPVYQSANAELETEAWERTALLICPLH